MTRMPAVAGDWPIPRSAYVHVPFCRHRCGYCNFSVIAGRDDLADDFLSAIEIELSGLGEPQPIDTLFLGGGTPTQLGVRRLERLFGMLQFWLPRNPRMTETTIEANPEDVTPELVEQLAAHGVNRISLGVQSFDDEKLNRLERGHNSVSATSAVELAAGVIRNVSVDLIFAAPQESPAQWRRDVSAAVSLPISHLSAYALTYEKGTSFWARRRSGLLSGVGEDEELEMYQDVRRLAAAAGLEQYEISNFARDGRRCVHNLAYWEGRGWYAFGPGAARFVGGRREVNHRSPTTYIRRVLENRSPTAESEVISSSQWACERAAFGIRMLDGIDLDEITRDSGVDIGSIRGDAIEACVREGWVHQAGRHWRLTDRGLLMADSVASALLG